MQRYVLIFILLISVAACGGDVNIPHSDERPSILLYCNFSDPQCEEMQDIIDNANAVDPEAFTFVYTNLNAMFGRRQYEYLELEEHPSFVIFDANGNEVSRVEGVFDRETVDAELAKVLP